MDILDQAEQGGRKDKMETQIQQRQTLERLEEIDALKKGDRILVTVFNGQTSETLDVAVQTPGTVEGPLGYFQFIKFQPDNKKIRMYEIRREDIRYDYVGEVLLLKRETTSVRDYSEEVPEYPNLIQTIKFAGLDEI